MSINSLSSSSSSSYSASVGHASAMEEEIKGKGNDGSLKECQVCCENFNKSSNKPVVCPYDSCAYYACISCVRTYLLENPQSAAHCMACKKPFNNLFLVQNLAKCWVNDTYLPQVSLILTEMELARLPESIEEAERVKKIDELTLQLNHFKIARTNHFAPIKKIEKEYRGSYCAMLEKLSKIRNDEYMMKLGEIRQHIRNIQSKINVLKKNKEEEKEKERKVFTMPCSYNECKGMLSTQYKCGLCNKYTCKECSEPWEDEHKCNPDNVATKKAILKDTRPCPKCSTRIFKIEGCDQMWCTNCKTPFSWVSGKIVPNGQRLHNPHAIEYLKQTGMTIRAPGDLVCGGLITSYQYIEIRKTIFKAITAVVSGFKDIVKNVSDSEYVKNFTESCGSKLFKNFNFNQIIYLLTIKAGIAYRIVEEVSRNKLRVSREYAQAHRDFNYERIQFILNKINKNEFSKIIKTHYKQKNSQTEMSYVWEIISTFGIEMFKTLYDASKDVYNVPIDFTSSDEEIFIATLVSFLNIVIKKLYEFSALVKYANSQLDIISVAHSITVPIINFDVSFPSFTSHTDVEEFIQDNQAPGNYILSSVLFKNERVAQKKLRLV